MHLDAREHQLLFETLHARNTRSLAAIRKLYVRVIIMSVQLDNIPFMAKKSLDVIPHPSLESLEIQTGMIPMILK